jgi:hypothetical protein
MRRQKECRNGRVAGHWLHILLIAARGRQRRGDFEFQASPVYRVSSRTTRATQRNPVSKKQTKTKKTKNKKQRERERERERSRAGRVVKFDFVGYLVIRGGGGRSWFVVEPKNRNSWKEAVPALYTAQRLPDSLELLRV